MQIFLINSAMSHVGHGTPVACRSLASGPHSELAIGLLTENYSHYSKSGKAAIDSIKIHPNKIAK